MGKMFMIINLIPRPALQSDLFLCCGTVKINRLEKEKKESDVCRHDCFSSIQVIEFLLIFK